MIILSIIATAFTMVIMRGRSLPCRRAYYLCHYIKLFYIIAYYVIAYYIILCHVMLYYVIL